MSGIELGLAGFAAVIALMFLRIPIGISMLAVGMLGYVYIAGPLPLLNHLKSAAYSRFSNYDLSVIPLFLLMGQFASRAGMSRALFRFAGVFLGHLRGGLAMAAIGACAGFGAICGSSLATAATMGQVALPELRRMKYSAPLATGTLAAGGTLGILIPPSVMLIVYAAVAGQSIVKLYAAAMLPGFFLTLLYLVYIIGWALIDPKVAPKLPEGQYRVPVPDWIERLQRGPAKRVFVSLLATIVRPGTIQGTAPEGRPATYGLAVKNVLAALIPLFLTLSLFAAAWWYVIIHNAPPTEAMAQIGQTIQTDEAPAQSGLAEPPAEEETEELGAAETSLAESTTPAGQSAQELTSESALQAARRANAELGKVPDGFYEWYAGFAFVSAILLMVYYRRMDGEQLEILKMLAASVVPLGVLTFVVLAVILFGITTATESAGVGVLGALYLASYQKYRRSTLWASLAGLVIGMALGSFRGDFVTLLVSGSLGAIMAGTLVPWVWDLVTSKQLLQTLKESTFLTAKTTAMVCWLFVGSALFSAVFALHGGQGLIERWVLGLDLTPLQFLILAQAIIFLLGWPLEWTEIIVIFVPIFIPLLAHFQIDPVLFGIMVAVNLQAAFLSPPVAMSAFYLKGVAPKHVTLNQIFAGMMPYMLIVILCLVFMYIWPGMTLWLPNFLYGN
jgi:TRAP-type mannitol/chloroaromatic compound transport system permease large subunit